MSCAEPDVELVGECRALSDDVVLPREDGAYLLGIGLSGEATMIEWGRNLEIDVADATLTWHQPDGTQLGEEVWLARAERHWSSRWVTNDAGEVVGLIRGSVDPDRWATTITGFVVTSRPTSTQLRSVRFPGVAIDWNMGVVGRYPAVIAGSPVAALEGPARGACPALGLVSESATGAFLRDPADPCPADTSSIFRPSAPELVTPGSVGVVARFGTTGWSEDTSRRGELFYLRVDPDTLTHELGPLRVGRAPIGGRLEQPRAASSSSSVLFADPSDRPSPGAVCFRLRVMGHDGSDARDAPWQPPCWRDPGHVSVRAVEMFTWGEHVALVYEQMEGSLVYENVGTTELSSLRIPAELSDRFHASLRVVLLTARGRRGSEPVELQGSRSPGGLLPTPAERDAGLDGLAVPFGAVAANEGSVLGLAWEAVRREGDAVVVEQRLRRFTCEALP